MPKNNSYDYQRDYRRGDAVAEISMQKDILLSKAIGLYLLHPEIEKHIMTDPKDDVMDEDYIPQLVETYID